MTESMFFMLYHVAQMLVLGFDWGSGETLLQEKNSTGRRWDSNRFSYFLLYVANNNYFLVYILNP